MKKKIKMKSSLKTHKFSLMTFNAWGNMYWEHRKDKIMKLFNKISPDIILIQGK
jgi:hypothetical protein